MNALVKRATLRMQLGSPEESLHDLLMAAELGPDNADVFHHRGQVLPQYISFKLLGFDSSIKFLGLHVAGSSK